MRGNFSETDKPNASERRIYYNVVLWRCITIRHKSDSNVQGLKLYETSWFRLTCWMVCDRIGLNAEINDKVLRSMTYSCWFQRDCCLMVLIILVPYSFLYKEDLVHFFFACELLLLVTKAWSGIKLIHFNDDCDVVVDGCNLLACLVPSKFSNRKFQKHFLLTFGLLWKTGTVKWLRSTMIDCYFCT